ncbi:Integrase core domain protein (plasmid) [Caballeronia sp. SBC1]|nr:Integrase core domain protein [Caballeronia sp. SBC2]QIN67112.1 Integrase core domain protein [Caballeronia sp. SBC1]
MKYGVIEQMRQQYPVPPMCRFLGVSTSGYYAWRKRPLSLHDQQAPRLEAQVRAAHERSRQTFGPERLQKDLANHGVQIGVHRIKRLRAKLGLRCKQKRKFKATTNSTHNLPVAPNILDQDFSVSAPNQAWCGDITYIATDEGWLYLAGLKDLFSGEIVGYAMSERMTKQLVMQALFRAVASHRPAYSTQRERPFLGKVNRDSTAKRTRIPRHREQTERSDAGPLPFYSDCGFAVNRLRVLRSDSPASVMR